MKSTLLLLFCLLGLNVAWSQVYFGVKGGVSTTSIEANDLLIADDNGPAYLNLGLKEANYGVHAGVVIQALFKNFLIQPEVNFNSNKVDYQLTDLTLPGTPEEISSEKYQYLDIPILLGFQFGPVRLQAGPEAHIFIASASDIDESGYSPAFDTATFGWLGGIGVDIWRALMLDIRYEGNFSNFGNHLEFNGIAYEFDQSPARLLFSLGFVFGKKKENKR